MCRYAWPHNYKMHYACLDCRISFKGTAKCPECGEEMIEMGMDFKAPRRHNKTQWRKLRLLHQHGYHFHSCGCTGPGYRPKSLAETKSFVAMGA